jgi:hypothetical protein
VHLSGAVLVDRYGRHGVGQAYATAHPHHLPNICVAKMRALADDSDNLPRWAREEGPARAANAAPCG